MFVPKLFPALLPTLFTRSALSYGLDKVYFTLPWATVVNGSSKIDNPSTILVYQSHFVPKSRIEIQDHTMKRFCFFGLTSLNL